MATLRYRQSTSQESLSVLLEVDETDVRKILALTPFDNVSANAWVEVIALRSAWGVLHSAVVVSLTLRATATPITDITHTVKYTLTTCRPWAGALWVSVQAPSNEQS